MSPLASGSFLTGGMVVCPCSGSTLSGIAHAASMNLIQRAADVHLKERRRLILVPRETPLSVIQLDNLRKAAEAGAVVLPAMPGWYHGVSSIRDLEHAIDECEKELEPLKAFIIPGGSRKGAVLHVCRTVCRRAERRVITLQRNVEIPPLVVIYLNRLSDLLFMLARVANVRTGAGEVTW